MTHGAPKTFLLVVFAAVVVATTAPRSAAENLMLVGTGGFLGVTGDVGDNLTGNGVVIGGILYAGLTDNVYVSGGGHVSFLGGADIGGANLTTGALSVTGEGGVLVYLVDKKQSSVRPFFAGQTGIGILRWDYSPAAQRFAGVPDDWIAFLLFAPEFGLEIEINELLHFRGGGRFVVSIYRSETREQFDWDIDGGNFVEIYAGLGFTL